MWRSRSSDTEPLFGEDTLPRLTVSLKADVAAKHIQQLATHFAAKARHNVMVFSRSAIFLVRSLSRESNDSMQDDSLRASLM